MSSSSFRAARVAAVVLAVIAMAAEARDFEMAWQAAPEPAGAVVALAYEPGTGRLAVADRGAVWVGVSGASLAPVQRARGVRELAFAPDGGLWIAGDEGLRRWREGRASEAAAPWARGAAVHRIRPVGSQWLAAGSDGLHLLGPGGEWTRLDPVLPSGEVTALATASSPGSGLWRVGAVVDGVAHWVELGGGAASPTVVARSRLGTPGDGPHSAADVWISRDASEAWTLLRGGCLVGPERVCPALPPGAEARRLFEVEGRWWLTTERGLWVAAAAAGPWRRAAPPLGSLESHAVAGGNGASFVATERGLLVSNPGPGASATAAGSVADLPVDVLQERGDPPIEAVRRAALDYLDLGAPRLRAMRQGVERRGWFPTLALRLDRDRDVMRRDDSDEVFTSGALHSLSDRVDDRSTRFETSLSFTWDLGDVLYHPESVDVSRETRELIELRDDVLDEIHHLYFERRRVLLELLTLPPGQPLEAARLRLRADELVAGIDAWTGGWFGRRAVRLAP